MQVAQPTVALGLGLVVHAAAAQVSSGDPSSASGVAAGPNQPQGSAQAAATQAPSSPPAAGLIRSNPASPLPNPNLASTAAVPPRRGFLRAEPFDVYPTIGVGLGWTDNLLGQAANPISTGFLALSPRATAETRSGAHTHSLRYGGSYGRYFDSPADDFAVHEFVGTTVNQFTARADLNATAFYLVQQDPRGLTSRQLSAEPDRWNGFGARMTIGYGALSAQGRLEWDVGFTDKQYRNNFSVTENLNVTTYDTAARFFYRTGSRTRVLTEMRYARFDYDSGRFSSDETRLLGGVAWDFAASTTGSFRAGYVRKNFDQQALSDYSSFTAEAALRYLIRSYSVVEFAGGRTPSDFFGTGFFNVDTYASAAWTHKWAGFLSTRMTLAHLNQDVRGADRIDKTTHIGMGGFFDVRSWLRLGAEFQHSRRASGDPNFEYTRNLVLFTVGATL